jgi:hypothetical protein
VLTGTISTIAGNGTSSFSGDNNQATSAALNNPVGVSVDTSGISIYISSPIDTKFFHLQGNVYIADFYNNRIRKVTILTGIITTIAGSSTSGGYSGDNNQATSATLNEPAGVNVDSSGSQLL